MIHPPPTCFFEFIARKGHIEGAGRHITFDFYDSKAREGRLHHTWLNVHTSKNGDIFDETPLKYGDFALAALTWAALAQNLRTALKSNIPIPA